MLPALRLDPDMGRLCPQVTENALALTASASAIVTSGWCQLTTAWQAQVDLKLTPMPWGGNGGEAEEQKREM